jgi:hypothetical protein
MKNLPIILVMIFQLSGATINFVVEVPPNTPLDDTIYIVGNTPEMGNWDPDAVPMERVDYYRWQITLDFPQGTFLEYKYTRGSWLTVEKGLYGEEILNRMYMVYGNDTVYDTALSWRDIPHPFGKGPYLSWISDPSTTITVSFEIHEPCTLYVDYGLTPAYGNTLIDTTFSAKHVVTIEGLSPGTLYHYRVRTSTGYISGDNTFKTAPIGSPFTFAVFGDNRSDSSAHQVVVNTMLNYSPDFVLNTGDLVSDGTQIIEWNTFFNIEENLLRNSPYMPAVGNHEDPENIECRFYYLFELPNNEKWYSFDYGNAHFICLDTETDIVGSQMTWLVNDLAMANQNPDIDWIIVYFHKPPYSSSSHGSDLYVRYTLTPIFMEYDVDLVFSGHDHDYERSIPINGVTYIVTGGGGAPLYSAGVSYFTVYSESAYHFVLITINGDTLILKAIRTNGTVMDSLILINGILPINPNLAGNCESELFGNLSDWDIDDSLTLLHDDGTHGDSIPGDGIYTLRVYGTSSSFLYNPSSREGFQIVKTSGVANPFSPGYNVPVWFDSGDTITFYFDTNSYDDGYLPESMIVYHDRISEEPGAIYFLVGDCQNELGGVSDWNPDDTTLILHDDGMNGDSIAGDGIYTFRGACTIPGEYHFKILTHVGSWQPQFTSFGYVADSEFWGEIPFTTTYEDELIFVYLDVRRGRTKVVVGGTGVEERNGLKDGLYPLFSVSPIPGEKFRIKFSLMGESYVTLKVYSVDGRLVEIIREGRMRPGSYRVLWTPSLPTGTYLLFLKYRNKSLTRKVVISR